MKKQYSIGWLIGSVVFLTAALVLVFLIPVRGCSLCGVARPAAIGLVPPRAILDCPQCDDRGKLTIARSWRGRTLSPRMAALLQAQARSVGQKYYQLRLEPIIRAGGKDPGEVLGAGYFMPPRIGGIRFVKGAGRPLLLVVMSEERMEDVASLILFDAEGAVLDALHATTSSPTGSLAGRFPVVPGPGGEVAVVSVQAEIAEFPPVPMWFDSKGRIPRDRIGAPFQQSATSWDYRIGVEADRLRIIPSGAPPAGP